MTSRQRKRVKRYRAERARLSPFWRNFRPVAVDVVKPGLPGVAAFRYILDDMPSQLFRVTRPDGSVVHVLGNAFTPTQIGVYEVEVALNEIPQRADGC